MRYSVQSRDRIFVKGYGFWYFAKNVGVKLLQKEKLKKLEVTGDLISNKVVDRITTISKKSKHNNSEKVPNENHKKYLKKDIYLQKKNIKLLMI